MKLKNLVMLVLGTMLVYRSGVISGRVQCLNNVAKKYGASIDDEELVDDVNNNFKIHVKNPRKNSK